MFGYIKPFKPQMRICEYETYKAVYCGLCKQLGRQYGPFSRLTLSYDFVFLALLGMSLNEEGPQTFSPARCLLNPFRSIPHCGDCAHTRFAGGVAVMMLYYKALDNYNDGSVFEKLITMLYLPFLGCAYRKAADRYPEVARIIYETISKQSQLENESCDSVDRAAEPTAQALSGILELLSQDAAAQRVLRRFGYLLGRYVYLADALDDLEEDCKKGSYNPFLLRERIAAPDAGQLARIRGDAKGSLFLTIGEAIKIYDLLELYHYKPILDNIVQLGLRDTVNRILQPKETDRR